MLIHLIYCITLLKIIHTQELEITNLYENPILLIKTDKCKIQTGVIKIVHPINLTDIEITIQLLSNIAYKKIQDSDPLTVIIKQKVKQLYNNFYQIKPSKRVKRWDIIGTTWKWISGSPDAEDLRIINGSLNHLVSENNQQVKINNQINDRILQLTNSINTIAVNSQVNKILLNEIDIITTIVNIDTLNKLLTDIQDAILLSKTLTANSRILSMAELHLIYTLLEEQGVYSDLPEEAMNYVTPKIATTQDTLLYILQVPQLSPKESSIFRLFPLNNFNTVIKNCPNYIIKHGKELFLTTEPLQYVQQSSFIQPFSDECILPMIMGTKTHCETISDNKTKTTFVSENSVLITNAKNDLLSTNCGPDNRTVSGNLLVSFINCTISFNQPNFTSKELRMKAEILQGSFHNLIVERKLANVPDIKIINNNTIQNRQKLDHIYLKQYKNDVWNWSLFGGLSLSTISAIIIFTFMLTFYKDLSNRLSKRTRHRRSKIAAKNSSVEDATFSPPGGVTVEPDQV
ncbi:uncharacterized protein LOC129757436 [Uranotaenia lowii]|uniref:uncharacterized protein LOC129757436 n=1 Tax=Uranotaenia lowii TaxID=190385 RepID=UPI002478CA6D|nr:uncharacterized protein LOC129757436 [Uranotaenia lowii]